MTPSVTRREERSGGKTIAAILIPVFFGIAASALVGQYLGAGMPREARRAARHEFKGGCDALHLEGLENAAEGTHQPTEQQRHAEAARVRENLRKHGSQHALW